ncbi:hypothetical protein ATCC90586_006785 [Pythium insidiosum]|nr:hypothetical protein ATCC90586_006785 [Pythium insidiosum]
MVTTRRTSARLQEKQEAAAAASGSDADSAVTPTSARASPRTRRSASKTTPTSATRTRKTPQSSGGKRGRPRKSPTQEEQEAAAAETSTVMEAANAQEEQVTKQLFQGVEEDDGEETASASAEEVETTESVDETADEPSAVDAVDAADPEEGAAVDTEELASDDTVEETVEVVDEEETTEEEVDDNAVSAAEEPEPEEKQEQAQAEKSDEEEEIVMMEESEEEEEEEEAAAEDAAGDEDDNEEDILAFAQLAASGISLSRSAQSSDKKSGDATASSKLSLVPDTLDSGAASRTKFIDFKGSKLAQGAKLVAETASREETKVLSSQLNRVAKSNRQRQEATDASSAGRKWFGMESHEMTEDARRDFALLRMRNYLDPKKFYKTSDHSKNLPKFFQFGTVVEGAHEFKSARLTKKERQQTFTDEIMADDQIRTYTKRVFSQIQDARVGKGKRKKAKTNLNHRRF